MTTPDFDITQIVPLKWKPIVGLVGSVLTFIVPTVLEYSTSMDQPWPWVIAAVVALLTSLGVYRAPYKPAGTVLAPVEAVAPSAAPQAKITGPDGGYTNPWR